ncbi:MAG: cell division protein ZapA [Flavobacteriales bacterium]
MQELKIKVSVANRLYPLTIKREDEEGVRRAVKTIEDRLKLYESKFEARDMQDLLSMCLLEMAVKVLNDEQKSKKEDSLEQQLLAMESIIDTHL